MTVYFNKDTKKWYCRFRIKDRTKHLLCRGATNKKEAEEIENGFKYRLQQEINGIIPQEPKKVYLSRLIELYTVHAKNNHKHYRNEYYYLKSYEKYFNNQKPVNTIKPSDIEIYKSYLKNERKLKNSSINRYLEILSKMFSLAIANGELRENPVSKVSKLKEDNISIRFLSIAEEKRLLESIDRNAPYLKPIVIMALQTGMRRGEILNLKWANIKDGYIELLDTKSGKKRNIPISSKLKEVLICIPKTSEYIFINPKTNKPYVDIKKSWYKVLNSADIKNFKFHDLRHTVATRMTSNNIDLSVVKDILGHTMISTTMRYAHPIPEMKKLAIDILSSFSEDKSKEKYYIYNINGRKENEKTIKEKIS